MERETAPNHDVHTYFGSAVLDTVFGTRKKFRSLITVKIGGKDVQTEQILVQKLPSSPMNYTRKSHTRDTNLFRQIQKR